MTDPCDRMQILQLLAKRGEDLMEFSTRHGSTSLLKPNYENIRQNLRKKKGRTTDFLEIPLLDVFEVTITL